MNQRKNKKSKSIITPKKTILLNLVYYIVLDQIWKLRRNNINNFLDYNRLTNVCTLNKLKVIYYYSTILLTTIFY